jgi:threonine dehydratase
LPIGSGWIAGIDGCPAGWMLVLAPLEGPFTPRLVVLPHLTDIGALGLPMAALAIDMPIGLPDRIEGPGRGAERAVRKLLGARQSSVFSIPVRAAVEALEYRAACSAAEAGSDPPRKIAKQAFNLFPKIRELDSWLRGDVPPGFPVVETHPELVFRHLKGMPLEHPKKTPEGKTERRALLLAAGIPVEQLAVLPPKGAGQDDLIDAWACLITARRLTEGTAKPHPENFERDRFGLPMAIFA